tara:strand:- start:195 stop:839 length:645 start_codon:yes stop_codon:yes gene_type:complete
MEKILFIIGGESTGLEIREVVEKYFAETFNLVFNVIGNDEKSCVFSYIRDNDLQSYFDRLDIEIYYIISMANHSVRQKFIKKFEGKNITPYNIIHPESMISSSAKIGKGVYLAKGAIISSFSKIDDHCVINFGVLIGHDAIVGSNCILNPGCKISGEVKVGENTLVGSNSVIKQGVKIGKNVLIDAMCYMERDAESERMFTNNLDVKEFKNIFK